MSLPTGVRAFYRRHSERSLTDLCEIQRSTKVEGTYGGTRYEWAAIEQSWGTTDVPCRVNPSGLTPRDTVQGEAVFTNPVLVVKMPIGTDVRRDDRIVWNDRTLTVVNAGERTYEIARRVICEDHNV